MRRAAAAGLVAVALACSPSSSSTGGDRASRFVAAPVQGAVPFAVLPARSPELTVVVVLAGDPVALVAAATPTPLRFDAAARARVASNLSIGQQPVRDLVAARGGQVLASFQHAVNGVKVRISARDLAALRATPGVVEVRPVAIARRQADQPDNAVSVPFIGAPTVWDGGTGFHGEGIKIAVIDTGIDYTHANFGGPGTAAGYDAAHAHETEPADPKFFGPDAPKVKGGTDLVGDAYDASAPAGSPALTPHPDPNPLDCNGHGSHVSGTATGFGVLADGSTFRGPYTALTVSGNSWRIGPGVAPLADLYSVRVFGCEGSTDVVVDAIDWAVKNGMNVINMSLGSTFGGPDTADALASENAAKGGIMVVASAGNDGPRPYMTGSPASGDRVISVAAMDSTPLFPGAIVTLSPSGSITAQNNNGAPLPGGSLKVVVLPPGPGGFSGCDDAEYQAAQAANNGSLANTILVTTRGSCARVDRAIKAQAFGAAAAAMINNAAGFGVFEGSIPGVTIPFLGVRRGADGNALSAAASVTLAPTTVPNPGFPRFATFSSGGPRGGDSALKPNITAPGVSILSTGSGTGNQGAVISGTSMASPHVAGVAALTLQAHPGWTTDEVRAAIVSTAAASKVADYAARLGGNGLVQPVGATATQVVALAQPNGALNLSFGFAELSDDFRQEQTVRLRNRGSTPATFTVSATPTAGSPHSIALSRTSFTVAPRGEAEVDVRLSVPAASAGNTAAFREVAGLVTFTPTSGNGGVALAVPYYLVPRVRANLNANAIGRLGPSVGSGTVRVRNGDGPIPANADFYAWGPSGRRDPSLGEINLRAAGAQSFDDGAGGRIVVFAVNTFERFSTAAADEFDVVVDTNADGKPDFLVAAADFGLVTAGAPDGRVGVFVIDLATGSASINFLADAPTDGSTLLMPVLGSDLGLTAEHPRFTYSLQSFDQNGNSDQSVDSGSFNAFTPAIETGQFVTVNPGATANVPVAIDAAEFARTPPTGVMVVNLDGRAGAKQAELIKAR
ncbi:MAG TPA: S8 family serine peptidase [Anaeromyxobacteraceae bacterium]|nr:S8 family serine peptidase [Anaeromyxobacteraceae bacterium]